MMQPHATGILQRGPGADVLFWAGYTLLTQLIFAPEPFETANLLIMLAFLGGEAVAIYGHLAYGLLPRTEREITLAGYLLVVFLALVAGILVVWGLMLPIGLAFPPLLDGLGPKAFLVLWLPRIGWSTVTLLAVTSVMWLFARRRVQAKRERDLRAAKTQAELAYLRSQLNPHFLFNALNNIYVLIDRDPVLARRSLAGFSDLLRYQLYRSEEEMVPLEEEIAQVRKFAELSRLRMEEDFRFDFRAPAHGPLSLPPLLFLPLLENAFKFAPGEGGFVRAELSLHGGRLSFTVANSVGEVPATGRVSDSGGIGLTNLRRRLELLYPGAYQLRTEAGQDHYAVELTIPVECN